MIKPPAPMRGCALGILALATLAPAQLNITARDSTQRYGYVHGGGPDAHTADVTATRNNLFTADTMHTGFFDSTAGEFAGHSWNTSVQGALDQAYGMTGAIGDASSITSTSFTQLQTAAAGDLGLASINSANPGNELIFHFMPLYNTAYHLTGSITGGSDAFTFVALQKFNGFTWDTNFISFSLPGPDVAWDVTGNLDSGGEYRLWSALAVSTAGNSSATKSLDYQFTAASVPEPASLGVIGLGIAALLRRRKAR